MTQLVISLGLSSGSEIPSDLILLEGNPSFNGYGLSLPINQTTWLGLKDPAPNNTIETYIKSEGSVSAYFRQYFRYIDENNYLGVLWQFETQKWQARKVVDGNIVSLGEGELPSNLGDYGVCGIDIEGDDINIYIRVSGDTTNLLTINESTHNTASDVRIGGTTGFFEIREVVFKNTLGTIFDLPPLNVPQSVNGFKRQLLDIQKLFDKPAVAGTSDSEYFFRPYLSKDFPNWPSEKYPVIGYSSTDHSTGAGGVYFRVYEELGFYDLRHKDSWHEWGDISGRPEFDHIQTKDTLIFSDSYNGFQTETPSVLAKDGTVYLFYHNDAVVVPDAPFGDVQNTKYVSGSNPVDFDGPIVITNPYDPENLPGSGHNGYYTFGENTLDFLPYNYVGVQLHGAGGEIRGAMKAFIGSNDGLTLEKIGLWRNFRGELSLTDDLDVNDAIEFYGIHGAKKEGAYYRVLGGTVPVSSVGGDNIIKRVPVEFLVDSEFNIVSRINFLMDLGVEGEFNSKEINNYDEITYEGVTYGFSDSQITAGVSGIGICVVNHVPAAWEIIAPHNDRTLMFSTDSESGIASNVTYSETPSATTRSFDNIKTTSLKLPMDGTESTAVANTQITLIDHDYIDVLFDYIGKDSEDIPIELEFGIADNVGSPLEGLSYYWQPTSGSPYARAQPMELKTTIGGGVSFRGTDRWYGQSSDWRNAEDEAPTALIPVGFRIIPSKNLLIVMEGLTPTSVFDIEGVDYSKAFNIFIKARLTEEQAQDYTVSFSGIRARTYTDEAIAVPSSPTLTTSKSSDSVTLTTGNVSGATGYKYFLNNRQNDTGVFTGLEPETTYTVYARASNELGDSAPSAIQTVTMDAAGTPDTTAPVVTNNGPATLTLKVGDAYTPDFSTNEGTLNISNPVDTSTAGTYTVTATATDAAGNEGSATQTVIVEEVPVNQPPIANAGPDQSVAAGVRVQLNASMSTDPEDGSISQFGWEQVDNGADAVVLEFANTATPEFNAPSSLAAQTLEFRVQAQDSEGATATDTVTVQVAALQENEILSTMETLDFELVTQGNLVAYKGRSNREVMQLKPSSLTGIVTAGGYLDLSQNGIAKIEIIADGKKISNENSDSIKIDGTRLLARLGDLDISTGGRDSATPTFIIVLYVGSDTRGLVVASNVSAGYKPLSYRVEEIA